MPKKKIVKKKPTVEELVAKAVEEALNNQAPQQVIVKPETSKKLVILQTMVDAQEAFADAQAEFAQAQKKIADSIGRMSLLEINSPNATISGCSFISTDNNTTGLISDDV